MNHNWLWILVGGVFETGWATGMKMSESFTNIIDMSWPIPITAKVDFQ